MTEHVAGPAVSAGGHLGRRGNQLLAVLRARRAGRAVPVRRGRTARPGSRCTSDGAQLALLPPGVGPGQRYGYRVHGPYAPHEGHRFNPSKLLIDPYAKSIDGVVDWAHDANVLPYVPDRRATTPTSRSTTRTTPQRCPSRW